MHDKKYFGLVGLVIAIAVAGYFGAYFLAANYTDFGDNAPLYLVEYRVGSVSLHRVSFLFEPARRVDELWLRRKHAAVINWQTSRSPSDE